MTLHNLETGVKGQIRHLQKNWRPRFPRSCFLIPNPLEPMIREILELFDMLPTFDIKDVIWWPFCFHKKGKITLSQAVLAIYFLCKSDTCTCNILNFTTYHCFSNNWLWLPCCFFKISTKFFTDMFSQP